MLAQACDLRLPSDPITICAVSWPILILAGVVTWGSSINTGSAPLPVNGFSNIAEVTAGPFHAAMRTKAGGVVVWDGPGMLTKNSSALLAQVSARPGTNVTAIASGKAHVLVLTDKGEVLCLPDTSSFDRTMGLCLRMPQGSNAPALAGSAGGNQTVRAIRASMNSYHVQLDDANGTWVAYGFRAEAINPDWLGAHSGRQPGVDAYPDHQPTLTVVDVMGFAQPQSMGLFVTLSGGGQPLRIRQSSMDVPLPAWAHPGALNSNNTVKAVCVTYGGLVNSAVALLSNGSVAVWHGSGPGTANLVLPADLPQGNITSIACGVEHAVVTLKNGTTRAIPSYEALKINEGRLAPPLGGSVMVKAVAAGYSHSVYLSVNGNVYQTGAVQVESPSPLPDALLSPLGLATSVSAGAACAVATLQAAAGGGVVGWGNVLYQLSNLPPDLVGSPVVEAAAGTGHALALLADGSVVTWGLHTNVSLTVPPQVRQARVAAVGAGDGVSVALTQGDGRVLVWGPSHCDAYNLSLTTNEEPATMSGVVQISISGSTQLVLLSNGTFLVNCGGAHMRLLEEYQGSVAQVAAGMLDSLLLLKSGHVVALGRKGSPLSAVPEAIQGQVVSISAGLRHALALLRNGSLVAWGPDAEAGWAGMPPEVSQGHVMAMSAGDGFSLAIVDPASIVARLPGIVTRILGLGFIMHCAARFAQHS
jgi:alpha-tubulin suppressor-like RCC1 family protein